MNIKKDIILDKELFNNLMDATFVKIEVGSRMYGLEHPGSDTDLLCIYNTSNGELNTFNRSQHQFQFTDNGVDYLFINIHSFISNTLSGDSTINFEVINSPKLIGTDLEFLYDQRESFYNYNIIRSYLGLAKRDLKRINIDGKTEFGKNKKIGHAYRGLVTAKNIYTIRYTNIMIDHIYVKENDVTAINALHQLNGHLERGEISKEIMSTIDDFRKFINSELDKGRFVKYMAVDDQKVLDTSVNNLLLTTKTKKMVDFDMVDFYDANEHDVKY